MAKNNALFRNSLGGYNKDDVTRYIEDLNIQFNEHSDELESQIKALKLETEVIPTLKDAAELCPVLDKENTELKKERDDLTQAIKAQGDELTACIEEKKRLEEKCTALEEKTKELEEKTRQLEEKLSALNLSFSENQNLLSSQKNEYEERISAIKREAAEKEADFISALSQKKQQEEIERRELEEQAEQLLEMARQEAQSVMERANELAEKIIENAKRKARKELSRTVHTSDIPKQTKQAPRKKSDFSDIFSSHKSKVDALFSSIAESLKGEER